MLCGDTDPNSEKWANATLSPLFNGYPTKMVYFPLSTSLVTAEEDGENGANKAQLDPGALIEGYRSPELQRLAHIFCDKIKPHQEICVRVKSDNTT